MSRNKSRLQTLLDKALAHPLDGSQAGTQSRDDSFVGAIMV